MISVKMAAKAKHVSPQYVREALRNGKLAGRLVVRMWYVDEESLQNWVPPVRKWKTERDAMAAFDNQIGDQP